MVLAKDWGCKQFCSHMGSGGEGQRLPPPGGFCLRNQDYCFVLQMEGALPAPFCLQAVGVATQNEEWNGGAQHPSFGSVCNLLLYFICTANAWTILLAKWKGVVGPFILANGRGPAPPPPPPRGLFLKHMPRLFCIATGGACLHCSACKWLWMQLETRQMERRCGPAHSRIILFASAPPPTPFL